METSGSVCWLLRNVLFAHHLRRPNEHAVVVALTRDGQPDPVTMAQPFLDNTTTVALYHRTWESIYDEICLNEESLQPFRSYFEDKSLNLRPAFNLHQNAAPGWTPRGA